MRDGPPKLLSPVGLVLTKSDDGHDGGDNGARAGDQGKQKHRKVLVSFGPRIHLRGLYMEEEKERRGRSATRDFIVDLDKARVLSYRVITSGSRRHMSTWTLLL